MRSLPLLVGLIAVSPACQKKQTTQPPAGPVTPMPAPSAKAPEVTPVAPNVAVSDDLLAQCKLQFGAVERAPKFGYDATALLPEDRAVLEKVASCVTTGPLKGKPLRLIGRADPRGTEEYNLGLGDRRANAVGTYLQRLGVPSSQVATDTRGALEARGQDEIGYQRDRRVDVMLQ